MLYRSYTALLCKEDAEKEMNQIENKRGDYEKAVNLDRTDKRNTIKFGTK